MLRAFRGTFLVAIDQDESPEEVLEGETVNLPTIEQVKEYLFKVINIVLATEEEGDPYGLQSLELNYGSLKELTANEMNELYPKK